MEDATGGADQYVAAYPVAATAHYILWFAPRILSRSRRMCTPSKLIRVVEVPVRERPSVDADGEDALECTERPEATVWQTR